MPLILMKDKNMKQKIPSKFSTVRFLYFFIIVKVLSACGETDTIRFSLSPDGNIWFENSAIQLRYDKEMYCKIFQNAEEFSITDNAKAGPLSKPSHYIEI